MGSQYPAPRNRRSGKSPSPHEPLLACRKCTAGSCCLATCRLCRTGYQAVIMYWSTPMTLVVPLRSRSMVHEASRRELSAISPVRQVSPLMSFVVICDLSGDAQPPDVSRKVAYPAEKIRTGLTRQRRKRSQLEAYCLSVSAILPGLVVVGANYYWQARHSS